MTIIMTKYKLANPVVWLLFSRAWQDRIHPQLSGRLAYLCSLKKQKLCISYGFRSDEEQIMAGMREMEKHPDYVKRSNGAIYNTKGQCMVAAPGNSSHGVGFSVDAPNTWIEKMTNAELEPYGLVKPMAHEPWHIELIEAKGVDMAEKRAHFYRYVAAYYPLDIRSFQMVNGLTPDNATGAKTKAKAAEVYNDVKAIALGKVTDSVKVKAFQTVYGLPADGSDGQLTSKKAADVLALLNKILGKPA
ncbi:MAG: hypothetical protein N2376_01230 [Clostridia bacterium]|nr:hypothetical protein [Clostridia bacterium]